MLELPEALVLADQLNESASGRTIRKVHMNAHQHKFAFYNGDPETYSDLLEGRSITGARAYGGLVELAAGTARLLIGDGVNLRYGSAEAALPAKHQLHLVFDDGSWLTGSVQMYGGIWAFPEGEFDNPYYRVAVEKPSPLTDGFDADYFDRLLQQTSGRSSLSAKAFLATEQRIPGLGNGVLQDILLWAGVNPRTPIRLLSDSRRDKLYASVVETLKSMRDQGGRDTEKSLFGQKGGYWTLLSSKTYKDPCPECGGTIRKEAYLGGSVYYCPTCQPAD